MHPLRYFFFATTIAWAFSLSGCTAGLEHGTIGPPVMIGIEQHAQPHTAYSNEMNRTHWPTATIKLPRTGVAHHPTYIGELSLGTPSPRQSGAYPTIDSALEPDDLHAPGRLAEGFLAIPQAAYFLLRAPFAVVTGRTPWSVETSPEHGQVLPPQHDEHGTTPDEDRNSSES